MARENEVVEALRALTDMIERHAHNNHVLIKASDVRVMRARMILDNIDALGTALGGIFHMTVRNPAPQTLASAQQELLGVAIQALALLELNNHDTSEKRDMLRAAVKWLRMLYEPCESDWIEL